ncbi:MAG: DUF2269 family protein [Chloroflexi bacterium]|nr:DUF2269 family protein [Chloroflexota bacterium]
MGWLFPWLLFAHVLGVVLAFGPTYAFGTYAGLAAREGGPARSFNDRARTLVNRRMVMPGTLLVLVTGFLLIWSVNYPWSSPSARWLQLSIVLYLGMIAYNLTISRRRQMRIGELMARARAAAPADGPPPPPSPEVQDLIHKVRRDGKAMGVIVILILFLMVVKPQVAL